MPKIVVIGTNYAGFWTAVSARRVIHAHSKDDSIQVLVIAPKAELVFRPRLYEADPTRLRMPLEELYSVTGVQFQQGTVESIDSNNDSVEVISDTGDRSIVQYDRLVLAAGSHVRRPKAIEGLEEHSFDVDNMNSAIKLEEHLKKIAELPSSPERDTVLVCGAGFTGIELSTELPSRLRALWGEDSNPKVILADMANEVGPDMGPGPRPQVLEALKTAGIEVKLGSGVAKVDAQGVTLGTGERINTLTAIWTAGVVATPLTQQIPGKKDNFGRLEVEQDLRVPSAPHIFATGDTARVLTDQHGHYTLMSCQHALILGRYSGHNAALDLLDKPTLSYAQPGYVTCLDLGDWGAVIAKGWDRDPFLSGDTGKLFKRYVNRVMIRPPRANLRTVFYEADIPADAVGRIDWVPGIWALARSASAVLNVGLSFFKL